jgi:hypothetical protein
MTQAPERIWATEDAENFGEDRFHTTRQMAGLTEYVRADLVQALVEALPQVLVDAMDNLGCAQNEFTTSTEDDAHFAEQRERVIKMTAILTSMGAKP